jgi:hypothetical protein
MGIHMENTGFFPIIRFVTSLTKNTHVLCRGGRRRRRRRRRKDVRST